MTRADHRHLTPDEVRALADLAGGVRPLARLLGVEPSTVSRWRSGECPSPRYVAAAVYWLLAGAVCAADIPAISAAARCN